MGERINPERRIPSLILLINSLIGIIKLLAKPSLIVNFLQLPDHSGYLPCSVREDKLKLPHENCFVLNFKIQFFRGASMI
jgi:hypothetical protein